MRSTQEEDTNEHEQQEHGDVEAEEADDPAGTRACTLPIDL